MLRVYNTLTREKETFEPVTPGKVGIYLCGPTVYKPPHIGHLVGPVIFDAVKRYLTFKGYDVTWVLNITDVDDKIIAEAARQNMGFLQLAEQQTQLYLKVLEDLGVKDSISKFPKASEHMNEIVTIIQTLIEKGHAYAAGNGDVWFDTASDADYGKLSNRRLDDQEAGLRDLAGHGKKNPADFALWKSAKPGEPAWESPWGKGRPGWHIECSAMSQKYLGDTFDIHGGGDDLKFPHHENEMAQSECCTGKPLSKYWMHNGLTRIKTKAASGEWKSDKMSKSLGNTISARDLIDTHGPDVVRYMLLSTHYRSPIEFSDEVLANVKKALGVFTRLFDRVARLGGTPDDGGSVLARPFAEKFVSSMDDDFNTAGACGVLFELAREINRLRESDPAAAAGLAGRLRELGEVLGVLQLEPEAFLRADAAGRVDAAEVEALIQARLTARAEKNWAESDRIRDQLTALGVVLEDGKGGTTWRLAE